MTTEPITHYSESFSSLRDRSINVRHIPVKRLFDIIFSLSILILGSPIFLAIALLVKVSSKGPIVYSHQRVGRGGVSFACYKFRTMVADADDKLNNILENDPKQRREWESTQKLKRDPRVTLIGHWLRKTSLDELPQFFNVLKGDLSVVGPRPVVESELKEHFGVKSYKILSVRPGITGLWQVSGRSNTSYEKRVMLDETYVDKQNLLLDLKLVLITIPKMIFSRGAY